MLTVTVDTSDAIARIDQLVPSVRRALHERMGAIATEIESDARAAARAHIRFLGAKNPGSYLASIKGGVSDKEDHVLGYVRSGHPLAHLMEYGFTISDLMIYASAGAVMAFKGDSGTVFSQHVHRHATKVKPYPAIHPAFEARKGEILAAIESIPSTL